jgi:hypothetical protein
MEDKMASGGTRMKCGVVTATGSAMDITTVGFRPRRVKCYNISDIGTIEWNEAFDDAAGIKSVAGTESYITSAGITPLANGFTLGALADINVADETVIWEAHE